MNDKKEPWEIGYSRDLPPTPPPPVDVPLPDFIKSATLVGQMLDGRFMIEKDLTETGADAGGIGLVYLARDMKLMGREVVVKILQKDALRSEETVRKFKHEKEALVRLEHPNIVRILDFGSLTDGNPFLVMEYIAGRSLRKFLQEQGTLAFDLVAHITESVTRALGAAHAQKILHRDIKPENVMLTPLAGSYDQVKLIDFGIARVEESLLAPQTIVGHGAGTLKYIAPEQLSGKLAQTPAADIYAVAIVIYEMLTGTLPFVFRSQTLTEAVIEMHELQQQGVRIRPSEIRRDLPHGIDDLLVTALQYDPAKRPQDAIKFGKEIGESLSGATTRTIPNKIDPALAATQPGDQMSFVTKDKEPSPPKPVPFVIDPFIPPTPAPRSKRPLLWATLVLLILIALAIPVGIAVWNSGKPSGVLANSRTPETVRESVINTNTNANANTISNTNTRTEPTLDREVSYFLNVQKMRGGKPFEQPFKSTGQEIFESGYKFSMVFQPDTDGYMYVYNEGKDAQGKTGYFLLFPTPSINGGASRVTAKQSVETAQNTFNGGTGTEVMWLIWIKDKPDDLEAVTRSAVEQGGRIKDQDVGRLQGFLEKYKADKPESAKDSANQKTVVKAKGDTVVHRFELEHR